MKRSLSIMLVLAMLVSVFVLAIPTGAAREDGGDQDQTKDWYKEPGWYPISTSDELLKIESGAEDYVKKYYLTTDIVLAASTTWNNPKYVLIDGDGHSITITNERSSMYSSPENIEVRNLVLKGDVEIKNESEAFNSPFTRYNSKGWVKMENVVSEVNIKYTKYSNRSQSVSGVYQSAGSGSYFKDVTYNGTVTFGKCAFVDYTGAMIGSATSTVFENVVNNGSLICESQIITQRADPDGNAIYQESVVEKRTNPANGKEYNYKVEYTQYANNEKVELGGIVGIATGCTFINCENNGSILYMGTPNRTVRYTYVVLYNPDGTVLKQDENGQKVDYTRYQKTANEYKANIEIGYVGGFAGYASGANTFENCSNNGFIVLDAYDERYGFAGGFTGYMTGSATFENCTNNSDIKTVADGTWYIGGLTGHIGTKESFIFKNCVNNGKLTSYNTGKGSTSQCAVAGIAAYVEGSSNGNNFRVELIDCVNNGEITASSSANMNAENWGGMLGQVYALPRLYFTNCINNADIVRPQAEKDGFFIGTGGFIGGFRLLGTDLGWIKLPTDVEYVFTNCVNAGNVKGVRAGGFYGNTTEIIVKEPETNENMIVTFDGCVNLGEITGTSKAGGFAAGCYSGSSEGAINIVVKNSANGGNIISENNAGGFFGVLDASGTLKVSNSVNYGAVGILDNEGLPVTASAAAIAANAGETTATGFINIGNINGKIATPLMLGTLNEASRGNSYLESSVEGEFDSSLAVSALEPLLTAINGMDLLASNYKQMLLDIADYRKYNSSTHLDLTTDGSGFSTLATVCDKVEATISEAMGDPLNYFQKDVNDLYAELRAALAMLKEKVDFAGLNDLLAKATEKLSDGNTYSETSVAKLNKAMSDARTLIAKGDKATAKEVKDMNEVLAKAIETLRRVRVDKDDNNTGNNTGNNAGNDNTGNDNNDNNNNNNTGNETNKPTETTPVTDTSATDATATDAVEESGCGSVIGGAAVVLVAVTALGMGAALKKRD